MQTSTTTTTCFTDSMESQANVRICLEVGHSCEPQEWRVWVRGVAGADISAFVRKVEFQLRPVNKFPYPERVFDEPPYLVRSSGFVPTEIIISIFLKFTTQPERIRLQYGPLSGPNECKATSRCMFYDVKNPTDELQMAVTQSATAARKNGSVLVLPNSGEVQPQRQTVNTSVRRPLQHKQVSLVKNSSKSGISKRKAELWSKQQQQRGSVERKKGSKGEIYKVISPVNPRVRENMKMPPTPSILMQDEWVHLHRMCTAEDMYLMSTKELPLPPLSDPLFRLPAPHPALPTDEPDYVLQ